MFVGFVVFNCIVFGVFIRVVVYATTDIIVAFAFVAYSLFLFVCVFCSVVSFVLFIMNDVVLMFSVVSCVFCVYG